MAAKFINWWTVKRLLEQKKKDIPLGDFARHAAYEAVIELAEAIAKCEQSK